MFDAQGSTASFHQTHAEAGAGEGLTSGGVGSLEAKVEGVLEGMVRTVLTVHLNLMCSLRQTGPFLDFDKASKQLEPLEGLSLSRLVVLSVDELVYFVGTYTHMMCYGALVLSHALLCTPASGAAVLFVLVMAALQVCKYLGSTSWHARTRRGAQPVRRCVRASYARAPFMPERPD